MSQFSQLVDHDRAQKIPEYCHDNPDSCDLCGVSLQDAEFLVDGEATDTSQIATLDSRSMGQWAYMCASCFATRGVAVAWGRGQLYQRQGDRSWLLVAGFPPEEEAVA